MASSVLDGEAAVRDALAFEFHHAAEALEAFKVGLAVASFEHADAVDDGGEAGRTPRPRFSRKARMRRSS